MKTTVFRSIDEWIAFRDSPAMKGLSLGFVPTMGALHPGHASLVEKSLRENNRTLVSIFINPTQFNDSTDLEKYPRTWDQDLALLEGLGTDFVLAPAYDDLYRDAYRYRIQEMELSRELCGTHRPGHFDGVLTVVMKLLQVSCADRAYFGEKDYQQYLLVKGMAETFFLRTKIVGCPVVREEDRLAMSSRNTRLAPSERARAAAFPKLLSSELPADRVRAELESAGFEVDYVEEKFGRRLGAVRIGEVRLIDNVEI